MIEIKCKKELYNYNAYHLAKAFFPDEKVTLEKPDASMEEAVKLVRVFKEDPEEKVSPAKLQGKTERSGQTFEITEEKDNLEADLKETKVSKEETEDIVLSVPERESRNETDKALYAALSGLTGKTLPWGLLTGVRPTKPAMAKIKEGMDREEFVCWYAKEKLVSSQKAGEAYDVASRERNILKKINPSDEWEDTASVYIGIPFCPSICSYCSFSLGKIEDYKDKVDPYLEVLCREIKKTEELCRGKRIFCVYIGGGTPTSLNEKQLQRLLEAVNESFPPEKLLELCVEAGRPDTITPEKLKILKEHKVTRISINPQTMQQQTLERVGRLHKTEDVCLAFEEARKAGFSNINMDLIAGLPGEGPKEMEDTLKKVLALDPENLTVHALAIKRRAAMESQYTRAEDVHKMIEEAYEAAKAAGMDPYYLYRQKSIAGNFENVGYAKEGREGLYNILTMEEVQTIYGLGAGADTKVVLKEAVPNPERGGKPARILRCSNAKDVDEYIKREEEQAKRKEALSRFLKKS